MMRRFPVYGPANGWWFPVVHLIFWVVILVALIALGIWLVRRVEHGPHAHPAAPPATRSDAALEHVRVRYARGEITREEYGRLMQDLGGMPPIAPPPPPPPPPAPPAP